MCGKPKINMWNFNYHNIIVHVEFSVDAHAVCMNHSTHTHLAVHSHIWIFLLYVEMALRLQPHCEESENNKIVTNKKKPVERMYGIW